MPHRSSERSSSRAVRRAAGSLPVSAFPQDGTFPTGTTTYEKRNIALEIPIWDEKICIECGKCALVCPHAAIRTKVCDAKLVEDAPPTFKWRRTKDKQFPENSVYSVQVAPEDCTGCQLCVEVCPAKDKSQVGRKAINMADQPPIRERERENWEYFLNIPEVDRTQISLKTIKNSQLLQPLFEFSGACAGCGETPYVKLLSQLFGDRIIVANATGCSSIYGGNLPTTPWSKNEDGRGPAWSNSLFVTFPCSCFVTLCIPRFTRETSNHRPELSTRTSSPSSSSCIPIFSQT